MKDEQILDVRVIEPKFKHPTIFDTFDQLEEDESFVIVNDHDPAPLYYQLQALREGTFGWYYLEKGPETWKVQITKVASTKKEDSIGQMVASDYRKALVFKKYGIDYCCGGKKSLKQVTKVMGLDLQKIVSELEQLESAPVGNAMDWSKMSLKSITEYIVNKYHNDIKSQKQSLLDLAHKVAYRHSDAHPELQKVFEHVDILIHEMTDHMKKEEQILFPYIEKIEASSKKKEVAPEVSVKHLEAVIDSMESEHVGASAHLDAIKSYTSNYTLPPDACSSYTVLYNMLQQFHLDLIDHVHLENNILFPRAMQLL